MKATIYTNRGNINLEFYPDKAPLTVANFANLANRGYYNNLTFHRVIDNFMVQGGCPLGTGTGNPGYEFKDEFDADLKHDKAGILSMANSGPGSNGSQFFITHLPTPWLDNKHTIFGCVSDEESQSVVNMIEQSDTIMKIEIDGDITDNKEVLDTIKKWNDLLDT